MCFFQIHLKFVADFILGTKITDLQNWYSAFQIDLKYSLQFYSKVARVNSHFGETARKSKMPLQRIH